MESCILLHPSEPARFLPGDCRGRDTGHHEPPTPRPAEGFPCLPLVTAVLRRFQVNSAGSLAQAAAPLVHCPRGQSPQHPQSSVPREVAVFMYMTTACQSRGTEPEPCCATCCSNGEQQKKRISTYINKPGTSPLGISDKKKKNHPLGCKAARPGEQLRIVIK